MAKVNTECKICKRAAKALAKRLGKEGYCTKHARMELAREGVDYVKDRLE